MATLGTGMRCLKSCVFILNIICLLCSLVLIGAGAYVEVKFSQYEANLHKVWQAAPIAIIVVGVVILIVSFLGCCGAIKENVCMLYMYAFFLIVLLIAELVAAIVAVVYKDKIDDEINTLMTGALENPNEEITATMDKIQTSFHCCGVKGPDDYKGNVPASCKEGQEVYVQGCLPVFSAFLKRNLIIVACVAFGVCFFQLLSIVIACCLGQRIHDYQNVGGGGSGGGGSGGGGSGKWKLSESHNFDAVMSKLGVSWATRQIGNTVTPTVTFTMDGDTMTMLTESTFKNLSVTFKFGEEFDEKTSDGRSVKSVVTKDSESKITQTQKDSKNTTVIVREIVGDTMKTTVTVDDVTAIRNYKRL
nr:multivalent antigen sj23-FABP [synthetic construct]